MEVMNNKAERGMDKKNRTTEKNMKELMVKMQEAVDAHEANPQKSRMASELAVLKRRLQWLQVVQQPKSTDLDNLLKQAMQDVKGDGAESSRSGTTALGSAGPCTGFQSLEIISKLDSHKIKIKNSTSMDELKANSELAEPLRKLYGVLMVSCRAALSDATAAAAGFKQEEEDEKLAEAKKQAADKRKKDADTGGRAKKALRKGESVPAALTCELPSVEDPMLARTAQKRNPKWDFDLPFLLTGQNWMNSVIDSTPEFKKFMNDFSNRFMKSTVRQSEGRCQLRVPESLIRIVETSLALELSSPNVLFGTDCGATAGHCVEYMNVQVTVFYCLITRATEPPPRPPLSPLSILCYISI